MTTKVKKHLDTKLDDLVLTTKIATINSIRNNLIDLSWSLLSSKDDTNAVHKAEVVIQIINKLTDEVKSFKKGNKA